MTRLHGIKTIALAWSAGFLCLAAPTAQGGEIDTPPANWQYVGRNLNADQVYVDRESLERSVEKTHMLRISILINNACVQQDCKEAGWSSSVMELTFSCKPDSTIFGTRDWVKYAEFSGRGRQVARRPLPQEIELLDFTEESMGVAAARAWGCKVSARN